MIGSCCEKLSPAQRAAVAVILLGGMTAIGCQPTGHETYPISGTVTLDGQPLTNGALIFTPPAGSVGPEGGLLTDGKFNMRAKAGTNKVEIRAGRERPGKKDPTLPASQNQEQYIPARYNTATELTAEVTPDGPNEFTFELTLKP